MPRKGSLSSSACDTRSLNSSKTNLVISYKEERRASYTKNTFLSSSFKIEFCVILDKNVVSVAKRHKAISEHIHVDEESNVRAWSMALVSITDNTLTGFDGGILNKHELLILCEHLGFTQVFRWGHLFSVLFCLSRPVSCSQCVI